jgi:hypothetical protein
MDPQHWRLACEKLEKLVLKQPVLWSIVFTWFLTQDLSQETYNSILTFKRKPIFKCGTGFSKSQSAVLWIRTGFNADPETDPDTAFFVNVDLDPDPGFR